MNPKEGLAAWIEIKFFFSFQIYLNKYAYKVQYGIGINVEQKLWFCVVVISIIELNCKSTYKYVV